METDKNVLLARVASVVGGGMWAGICYGIRQLLKEK